MTPSLRKRDARAGADLLAVLYPHRLCRDAAAALRRCSSTRCEAIGASTLRILLAAHPAQRASPIIVRATIGMGFTILVAAVLGFLGMGATPPAPDWGLTIAREPHLSAAMRGGIRSSRDWRSSSPCSASTCSATGCATSSIHGCGGRDERVRSSMCAGLVSVDPHATRASPACSTTLSFALRARPHPRRRRRVRLRQVDAGPRHSRHSAAHGARSRPARSASRATICSPWTRRR